jgi:serine/threonine protein kinase
MNSRPANEENNDNEFKGDGHPHTLMTAAATTTATTTTTTTRGDHVRKMELFYYDEVIRGPCLGHGSFADVYEVQHFQIHSKYDHNFCQDRRQARTFYSQETNKRSSNKDDDNDDDPTSVLSATTTTTTTSQSNNNTKYAIKCLRPELFGNHPAAAAAAPPPSDLKKLFQRAAKDMEMECDLLASIDHPHIVKVYATSASGTLASSSADGTTTTPTTTSSSSSSSSSSNNNNNMELLLLLRAVDFFLIEDRLVGTLTEKVYDWKVVKRSIFVEPLFFRGGGGGGGGVKPSDVKKKALWEERLMVANGVASALAYLHSQKIIYRDLKPDNVGFDRQGTCKLFDFGLARRLPNDPYNNNNNNSKNKKQQQKTTMMMNMMNDTYVMSGKTGNMLLMAPEVWHQQPYNEKADVYSFAMLLWMILALDLLPYRRELLGSDTTVFTKRVMTIQGQGERPLIPKKWPKYLQLLLRQAWSYDMHERPTMNEICFTLKKQQQQQQQQEETTTTTATTATPASGGGRRKGGFSTSSSTTSSSSSSFGSHCLFRSPMGRFKMERVDISPSCV